MYRNIYQRNYSLMRIILLFLFFLIFWETGKYTISKKNWKTHFALEKMLHCLDNGTTTDTGPVFVKGSTQQGTKDDLTEERRKKLNSLVQHMLGKHEPPRHHRFNFNISHSQAIPLTRDMPDIRSQQCKNIQYDIKTLPKVSVVSPFYNEELTVLLRHVHSLLRHTPRDLLREIILVNDMSTLPYLGIDLENYFNILDSRIVVIRNRKREGLARSRIIGANAAKEEVLMFLDSHMEFNVGWLEPLVSRLSSQSKLVVQPHVITIPAMERGHPEPLMRSAFGWDLRLSNFFMPPYLKQAIISPDDPFPTPTLVGCAIAVKRNYFFENGAFDPFLELWGAEHFELSFRTWMCGGRIETIPCSKIAHLFRRPPYLDTKVAMETVTRNIFRVAEIWMDEYKHIVYAALKGCCQNKFKLPFFTENELEEHKIIRRPGHCKNFDWFINHVMPEVRIPSKNAVYYGEVHNVHTSYGLAVTVDGHLGVTTTKLHRAVSIPGLYFTIDKYGRFIHQTKCVYFDNSSQDLKLSQKHCFTGNNTSYWSVDPDNGGRIVFAGNEERLCLTHAPQLLVFSRPNGAIVLKPCDTENKAQRWYFPYHFDWTSQSN